MPETETSDRGCRRGCAWIAGILGGGAVLLVLVFSAIGNMAGQKEDRRARTRVVERQEPRVQESGDAGRVDDWREHERRRLAGVQERQAQINAVERWYSTDDFEIVGDEIPAPGLNVDLYKRSIRVRLSKCGNEGDIEKAHGLVLTEAIDRSGETAHGVVIFYFLPGMRTEGAMYARTSRIEGWPFAYGSLVTDQPPGGQSNPTGRGAWSWSHSSREWVMVCDQDGEVVAEFDSSGWAIP